MAAESLLYRAIFTLLMGFIIFVSSIINKTFEILAFMNNYFVLFLFSGFVISTTGIVYTLNWHFKNRGPFYEEQQKTSHFIPYLAFGILLILIGFISIFYIEVPSKNLFIMTMSVSITGILLLINGLRYFVKEAVIQKTPERS